MEFPHFGIVTWLVIICAAIGGERIVSFISQQLIRYIRTINREAKENRKQIEFSGLVAGVLGTLLAIASFAYTITKTDDLDNRVVRLEHAAPTAVSK